MRKPKSYLVRWKSQGMFFWRWNFIVGDGLVKRLHDDAARSQSSVEYMVLHKRNGARIEVPYGSTCFIFSKGRAKLIREQLSENN